MINNNESKINDRSDLSPHSPYNCKRIDRCLSKYSSKNVNTLSKDLMIEKLKKLEKLTDQVRDPKIKEMKSNLKTFQKMSSMKKLNETSNEKVNPKKCRDCCSKLRLWLYETCCRKTKRRQRKKKIGTKGTSSILKKTNVLPTIKSQIYNSSTLIAQNESSAITISNSFFSMEDVNYLIYPDSLFRKFWDTIITILLFYTALILPYTICFNDTASDAASEIELMIDFAFIIDLLLNFFSAYENEAGIIIDDMKIVIWNYLKGWFCLDFIGAFPIQLVITQSDGSFDERIKIYKLLRLIRMIKMLRVLKYGRMMNYIFLRMKINLSLGKIISICFLMVLIIHVVSCLWYFTTKFSENANSWLYRAGLQDSGNLTIYISAVYWASTTIFTVGFGDIRPQNNFEKAICLFWMILGAGFYSYAIGNLLTIIQNYDKKESLISNKMDRIDEFTSKFKLTSSLSTQIKSFFQYKFSENFIYDTENLIDELSEELTFKVIQTVFASAFKMFDIFQNNPPISFVNNFIMKMKSLYIDEKNYVIYKFGEIAEEVYFVITGRTVMMDEDENQVITYGSGVYFGEVEAFFDELRIFTVKTTKSCEILFISKTNYLDILNQNPRIFQMEIYKAYKRRRYYMAKIMQFRNEKLLKMGKIISSEAVKVNESFDQHSDMSPPVRTWVLDQPMNFQTGISKQTIVGDNVMDRINLDYLSINKNDIEDTKDRLLVLGKEFRKHFKKIAIKEKMNEL